MKIQAIITAIALCVLVSITAIAQDRESPTPAPSKTFTVLPTATATSSPASIEATASAPSGGELPIAQAQMQTLVGNVQRPNGIAWFDDNLYTACSGDWTLYEVDSRTGDTITFVFGVRNAHTLLAEASDTGMNLWIPDFDTDSLVLVTERRSTPELITDELAGPWGIVRNEEDSFLVSNLKQNNISVVSVDGTVTPLIEELRSPTGLARDGDVLYLGNAGSARRAIEMVDLGGDGEFTPEPLVSGLQGVGDLVLADDGHLYFTYALGATGVVGRVQPEECVNGCTHEDVEIVVLTDLPAPLAGLVVTEDRRLFVHTIYSPEIYWVQLP
jgi:hypothetical protein